MTQFCLKRLNFTQKLGASIQTMCTTLVKVTTFLYQRQSTRIDLREVELDWFDDRLANVCQRWSNDLQMAQTCPSFNTQIKLKQDKYLVVEQWLVSWLTNHEVVDSNPIGSPEEPWPSG